jgi:hypothetical protein
MGLFNWFSDLFSDSDSASSSMDMGVNPATGLPMMDDSMIDVAGNPYGTDLDDNSSASASAFNDDGFSSDDSFSSSGSGGFSAFDDDDNSSFGGGGSFSDDDF